MLTKIFGSLHFLDHNFMTNLFFTKTFSIKIVVKNAFDQQFFGTNKFWNKKFLTKGAGRGSHTKGGGAQTFLQTRLQLHFDQHRKYTFFLKFPCLIFHAIT